MDSVTFYVPIHSNSSQVEHTAPFIAHHGAKLFFYDFNPYAEYMKALYRRWPNTSCYPFTEGTVCRYIHRECVRPSIDRSILM